MDNDGPVTGDTSHEMSPGALRAALDALECQVAVLEPAGRVVLVNEAWRRGSQEDDRCPPRSDVGTNYMESVERSSIPRAVANLAVEGIRAVLARGTHEFSCEYPCHSAQQKRWFKMHVTPCNIFGSPHAVIAHRSITMDKLVEEALCHNVQRLVRLMDDMPHLMWTATAEGRVVYGNAGWHSLVGVREGEPVETVLAARLHPEDRPHWMEVWREALHSGRSYRIEHRLQCVDGSYAWHLECGTPLDGRAEGPERWLVTATSIEENMREQLDLRVAVRHKDQFFATLLHELRNPLAPIANAIELLGRRAEHPPSVSAARNVIQRQLRLLTRLVDDLFDMSRIGRGAVEIRRARVDLADVVATAVETATPLIDLRHHHLTTSVPPSPLIVEADAVRLAQVLTNLLINAAKYTHPGGHISVACEPVQGVAVVRVRDDGIGISRELLPEIFELFTQAQPRSEAAMGGLGVGLAIARQLIELHGGSISAHSDGPGRGSEFAVRLPVAVETP